MMSFDFPLDLNITIVIKLLLAATLGGIIGLEREIHRKPAGLRTNMFICLGSALFTILSAQVVSGTAHDPGRIAAQIITGIDGHQSQLINRMRHGDMIVAGQSLYILEVHPAAYAALAANEAEKAAPVHLLEMITFGAFGRLWMGGGEAEIEAARAAAEAALAGVRGRASS